VEALPFFSSEFSRLEDRRALLSEEVIKSNFRIWGLWALHLTDEIFDGDALLFITLHSLHLAPDRK